MKVVVDGLIYQVQPRGGISRIYNEILPRMLAVEPALTVKLITTEPLQQSLPVHPRLIHRPIPSAGRALRPIRFWAPVVPYLNAVVKQAYVGTGKNEIWHPTYYTLMKGWKGRKVVTVVDMIHERFPHLFAGLANDRFRAVKKQCISSADAVICISETTRQDVQQHYGLDATRLRVVPLSHNATFTRVDVVEDCSTLSTHRPFILYIGKRSRYKNFDLVARAFSCWSKREEFDLVVVGNPLSDEEMRKFADLGIAKRVHSLGALDDQQICCLYNRAAALVFPSLYEGFGLPLLEAMACGCPVVASAIPSTLEVAGQCPVYFEPTSEENLLEALTQVALEGRNSERVNVGLQLVQNYSWDKTAQQTLQVYYEVEGKNR